MRALERKLFRDAWRLRGQIVSIALVVAAGVMSAFTMRSTLGSLEQSRDSYYRDYRMPDVFASLNRAPERMAERIAALPGVSAVEARVTLRAVLAVPGLERPATGFLVSVPDGRRPVLGDLYLRAGRYIEPGRDDEVLVSERFADVNTLRVGDTLSAVLNGRFRTLNIVGIALSPEFVYEIDAAGGFLGDERLFGVLWMSREALAAARDMTGAFNDLAVRLSPGASERAVLDDIDALLRPFGGLGAYSRSDQLSNRLVADEIAGIRATAAVVPVIFLGVAAFLLHIVLARLLALEREQIATLKAFGYDDRTIGFHYLGMAVIATGVGAVIGLIAGFWLGSAYTDLYARYFRFPELRYSASWDVAGGAIFITALAALGGAWSAVRDAARLQPAEGMRPAAPPRFKPLLVERIGFDRALSPAQRMILRNMERRPMRALLSAIGVAAALAVLLTGFVMLDSMDGMIDLQFGRVQREHIALTFTNDRNLGAAQELARLPGVVDAEVFRAVPVRLSHGHRSRRLALTGLDPAGELRLMIDADGGSHPLPYDGVVLTERLARSLRVAPFDTLRVELLDRGGEVRTTVVAATMDELLGVNGYLSMDALARLVREEPRANGAWIRLERGAEQDVLDRLRSLPAVASTTSKNAMLRSFEDQVEESFTVMSGILLTLASILATGVIYNGARIALSERGRELASLRVLGFTRREVAAMLLGEQAVITFVALPLGALLGAGITAAVLNAYDTELYRIPLVLRAGTFAWAAFAIVVVAAGAAFLVRRRLDRSDLIAVLKTRE